jgi:hypothetical protein
MNVVKTLRRSLRRSKNKSREKGLDKSKENLEAEQSVENVDDFDEEIGVVRRERKKEEEAKIQSEANNNNVNADEEVLEIPSEDLISLFEERELDNEEDEAKTKEEKIEGKVDTTFWEIFASVVNIRVDKKGCFNFD